MKDKAKVIIADLKTGVLVVFAQSWRIEAFSDLKTLSNLGADSTDCYDGCKRQRSPWGYLLPLRLTVNSWLKAEQQPCTHRHTVTRSTSSSSSAMSLLFPPPLCNHGDMKRKEDGGIGWRRDTSLWASLGRFREKNSISTVPLSKGKRWFWRDMRGYDRMVQVQKKSVNINVELKIIGSVPIKPTCLSTTCQISVELNSNAPLNDVCDFFVFIKQPQFIFNFKHQSILD